MPDRKLTLQRLDFSSCFIVLVIPTIYEKQKMKRNNTKLIYVYLWSMCITWHKLLQKKQKQTVAMPKDIIINDYSKDICIC